MRLKPAVLLDRDGVINEDSDNYVQSWAQYRLYPGALEALRQLHGAGCEVYLVTNQAGVGRGLYPYRNLLDIHLRLRLTVRAAGGLIHGVAYCLHRHEAGCGCRKPRPGMLLKLAAKYGLDLGRCVLVGDRLTDMQVAQAVGAGTVFLDTFGGDRPGEDWTGVPPPDYRADSLLDAVPYLLGLPQFARPGRVLPASPCPARRT